MSLVPEQSRALFACLLIAIMSLTTVVVRQDKKITQTEKTYQKDLQYVTTNYQNKLDSLNKVIFIIKDDSKAEALKSLERIISDQKQVIEEQKKLNKVVKPQTNNNALINGTYKTNTKLK